MALAHLGPIEIQTSPGTTLVAVNPSISYDAYSDELIFKLDSDREQTFSFPVNDFVSILYDDDQDESIGIQIDHFATYAIREYPALAIIAKVTGIEPRTTADVRLFREGRTIRRENEFTAEDEAAFKAVIRQIIDVTGGFDPDIEIQHSSS